MDFSQTPAPHKSAYPFTPPIIKFLTKIYHPNINCDGEISHSNLTAAGWSPSYTISQQMVFIEKMIYDSEPQRDHASEKQILEFMDSKKD